LAGEPSPSASLPATQSTESVAGDEEKEEEEEEEEAGKASRASASAQGKRTPRARLRAANKLNIISWAEAKKNV